MSQVLKNLLILLNLEKIEEGPFRGQNEDLGLRQVPGGQVIGQTLYAAKEIVPDERLVHSFHSYLLRPDDSEKPIIHDVEMLRDGNSSSAHRVSTIQSSRLIFYMTASFQASEAGLEHQKTMSSVSAPDGLPSETRIAQSLAHLLPPVLKNKLISDRSLEIRPVEFHSPLRGHVAESHRRVWIRTNGSVPDDLRVHQYLLGYASDLNLLSVVLRPHGTGFLEPGIQTAIIGHSIWFHCPFNLNEWLLYGVKSTSTSSVHDFVHGEFYIQDGVLVASTVQEGAMRNHN